MENELLILKSIGKNSCITQRDISKSTGMSLGNVNILIKRLVRKGLLKIERINPRTIKYIITPQGMKEKLERTYNYLNASIIYINKINEVIESVVKDDIGANIKEVYLLGENDDTHKMLKNRFKSTDIKCSSVYEVKEISKCCSLSSTAIIWHPDFEEAIKETGIPYINLLDKV